MSGIRLLESIGLIADVEVVEVKSCRDEIYVLRISRIYKYSIGMLEVRETIYPIILDGIQI